MRRKTYREMLSVQSSLLISSRLTTLAWLFNILEGPHPSDDLLARARDRESSVLGLCGRDLKRRRPGPFSSPDGLGSAEHNDGRRKAGSEEDVRGKADDSLNEIFFEKRLRIRPSASLRKSAPCGSTTAMRPVPVGHRRDHVLNPRVVAIARPEAGRTARAPRISLPDSRVPSP